MMNSEEKKLIKEFTPEELEILKNMQYSEEITVTIRQNKDGEIDCNITFSDQSPNEIAKFLYNIDNIEIRPLINLALMNVKERDELMFGLIAKNYVDRIDKAERREINQPIMYPSQVIGGQNGQN